MSDTTVTPLPVKAKRKPYVPTGRPVGRPKGSRTRPKPEALTPPLPPRTLQIGNAARYADVSITTMRKWIREGRVPVTRIGVMVLVIREALDAVLEGRRP
jgi:excisionase family DNA binding protein